MVLVQMSFIQMSIIQMSFIHMFFIHMSFIQMLLVNILPIQLIFLKLRVSKYCLLGSTSFLQLYQHLKNTTQKNQTQHRRIKARTW